MSLVYLGSGVGGGRVVTNGSNMALWKVAGLAGLAGSAGSSLVQSSPLAQLGIKFGSEGVDAS